VGRNADGEKIGHKGGGGRETGDYEQAHHSTSGEARSAAFANGEGWIKALSAARRFLAQ
jgi:hypothetical protein